MLVNDLLAGGFVDVHGPLTRQSRTTFVLHGDASCSAAAGLPALEELPERSLVASCVVCGARARIPELLEELESAHARLASLEGELQDALDMEPSEYYGPEYELARIRAFHDPAWQDDDPEDSSLEPATLSILRSLEAAKRAAVFAAEPFAPLLPGDRVAVAAVNDLMRLTPASVARRAPHAVLRRGYEKLAVVAVGADELLRLESPDTIRYRRSTPLVWVSKRAPGSLLDPGMLSVWPLVLEVLTSEAGGELDEVWDVLAKAAGPVAAT